MIHVKETKNPFVSYQETRRNLSSVCNSSRCALAWTVVRSAAFDHPCTRFLYPLHLPSISLIATAGYPPIFGRRTDIDLFNRRSEAAAVYQKGIQRRARPVDPLKRRFEDFKTRTKPPPPKSPTTPTIWQDAPSETRALRRAPLKNHTSSSTGPSDPPSSSRLSSGSGSNQPYNPYELMLQPPPPGKRKENLRFNLSLLFTAEGHEYCMQEARARSMGLLGKKWGPPPDADRNRRVGFSGDPSKGNKTTTRKFATAEPTVTLATKEALADVFGMYNSPEKSMRFGPAAGSKHAPVREIKPMTPMGSLLRAVRDENGDNPSKTREHKPITFVVVFRLHSSVSVPTLCR